MKKYCFLLFFLLFSLIVSGEAFAEKFSVFCANGKIEVDSRTLQQMIRDRGRNVYAMVTYDYRMDANEFAKKMGGIGAKCPKK